MQIKYKFRSKELSRMELLSLLERHKIIGAISKYVDPITLNKIINSGTIEFLYKSKYELLDILETLFIVKESDEYEEYTKAFLKYRNDFIKNFKIVDYAEGCGREYSEIQDSYLDTFSVIRDVTTIPFEIYTEYLYDKNDIKAFIDIFGSNIISNPVVETIESDIEGEEISIDDSLHIELLSGLVAIVSELGSTLAVEEPYDKSKYNWIKDDEIISKIEYLSPEVHKMGITYFYSKDIDSFIERMNNENELMTRLFQEFNILTSNTARDTLTHSQVKIIDNSSRLFPRYIRNKYAIICGFTSPGSDCTCRTMDISHSEFTVKDGNFLKSVLNSINNISEIIRK